MKKKKKKDLDIDSVKGQLIRALADYDNLRKRVEIERESWVKFAGQRVLDQFLPVLDMLEKVQEHTKDSGLEIVINEFRQVLIDEGLEEIMVNGETKFDSEIHEAVEAVGGGKKGVIAELMMAGWKYKDGQVIRPAKVRVYKGAK